MSSHHIIREKQEPALYIHRLGAFDEESLGQLLEWSPVLIVAASEYEKVLSLGVKIDIVAGTTGEAGMQENTRFVYMGEALPEIVKYLITEQHTAVNIIGNETRFDDLEPYLPEINIVLFTEKEKSYAIKSGFSIWKPQGSIFRVDIISYFETSNLRPDPDGHLVVIKDGFVTFNFTSRYLFISEPL